MQKKHLEIDYFCNIIKLLRLIHYLTTNSIFDDDNSGTVDYKELIIGLEMFKENSIDDKLKSMIIIRNTTTTVDTIIIIIFSVHGAL